MYLNSEQMLPARVRTMRQMADLLDAEDVVIGEINRVTDEMYQRESKLEETLVNEDWIEENLTAVTGGIVFASKRENLLVIDIRINVDTWNDLIEKKTLAFLDKWLPAHLKYVVVYEKTLSADIYISTIWQDDEVFMLGQVII